VDDSKAGTLVGSIVAGSVSALIIFLIGICLGKTSYSMAGAGSSRNQAPPPNSEATLNDRVAKNY